MDASVAHCLAATDMGTAKLASWLQKYLYTQKEHTKGNNSERK